MFKLILFLILMLVSVILYSMAFIQGQGFFLLGAVLLFLASSFLAYNQSKEISNKRHEIHTN